MDARVMEHSDAAVVPGNAGGGMGVCMVDNAAAGRVSSSSIGSRSVAKEKGGGSSSA